MSNQTSTFGLALDDRSNGYEVPSMTSSWFYRLARRAVFSRLSKLQRGAVTLVEGQEQFQFGRITSDCQREVSVIIHNPRVYADIALEGTVGAGEAYGRGWWSCDDLTALVRIFVKNRMLLDSMEEDMARMSRPLHKVMHWLNRNTKTGSRKNIAAHYDLGNQFFRLMLDETMMYSCAYFERPDATLVEASRAKNDRICRKLQLAAHDHLLEIGSGWGGFAIHAASHYGCRVTTTTISQQQYDMALQRVREAGLSDRIGVLLMDYRNLPELASQFDKLVSIEMIEAVGHQYYRTFFEICSRMLKSEGLALIQGITIDERFYERAKRSVDFIQRFIFPGSCIPSVNALTQASAEVGDLGLIHLEDIGAHYAPTLRAWRRNIVAKLPEIRKLGYQPDFLRLWNFYLSYCEGGFLERSISTVHMLFSKPEWRPQSVRCLGPSILGLNCDTLGLSTCNSSQRR
ncbi:MAG: cyclopropane-fatty-acyl-phospholipid synthase family protein [Nitrospira sp.]|jgi:cyclopropane-fatty-acyl-phospholipid synthase|nr:cyclopropane-fatty-acyl-phospholipid synthase family protein [Nitrospira sp.]MDH4242581.1 cyclopropane-fatty-acyl-phospholipid synthase family protein [Nitrospira sp.]MDH4355508.1 cyclopropane-fatty-acyl-phospholipid synthase family protein [Nitrospira sp.]MDH5317746.1 cyclopropane-fatty-acyl-phospholipid synthase family protein [Nitrospira sp.]